ncbi:MAG: hypothetical protein C0410_09590 [Anaerolinea sp.]|nr:hypothetical protein [Anaerolinea sp.]
MKKYLNQTWFLLGFLVERQYKKRKGSYLQINKSSKFIKWATRRRPYHSYFDLFLMLREQYFKTVLFRS